MKKQKFRPMAIYMNKTKSTNPKDVQSSDRIDLGLASTIAMAEYSLAMVEGLFKYGAWNYRVAGVRASVYIGAALRHLQKYKDGENRDPKTCVHHLGSVMACVGILLDAAAIGKLIDDRPPSNPKMSELLDGMEERVKHLREMFKDRKPRHYTIDDTEQYVDI